jgi:hypothetical protein
MGDFVEETTSSVIPFFEIGLLSRRELSTGGDCVFEGR